MTFSLKNYLAGSPPLGIVSITNSSFSNLSRNVRSRKKFNRKIIDLAPINPALNQTTTKDNSSVTSELGQNVTDGSIGVRDNGVFASNGAQIGGFNLEGLSVGDNSNPVFNFESQDPGIVSALESNTNNLVSSISDLFSGNRETFSDTADALNGLGDSPRTTNVLVASLAAFFGLLGVWLITSKRKS